MCWRRVCSSARRVASALSAQLFGGGCAIRTRAAFAGRRFSKPVQSTSLPTRHVILQLLASPARFERAASRVVTWRSDPLSYGEMFEMVLVRPAGVEPARHDGHEFLRLARIPVPPRAHVGLMKNWLPWSGSNGRPDGYRPSALPLSYTAGDSRWWFRLAQNVRG